MAVYTSPLLGAPPIVMLPICFTGIHAWLARNAVFFGYVIVTAAISAALLAVLSLGMGPEVVPQIVAAALGALAGAIGGAAIGAAVVFKGSCTCPPGATGFCIVIVFLNIPGTRIYTPLAVLPAPTACAVLIPPGCP